MRHNKIAILTVTCALLAFFFQACEKIVPATPAADEILDGPVDGLSAAESSVSWMVMSLLTRKYLLLQQASGLFLWQAAAVVAMPATGKGIPIYHTHTLWSN